jgi:drug/metabolite transporter (DMT)-like permease
MFNGTLILIIIAVVVIAAGQILFKIAATNLDFGGSHTKLELIKINRFPLLLIGLALTMYLGATIAWVQALRSIPLSIAYLFNALPFVLVPVAGFLIFSEPIPRFYVLGTLLIVGGILLIVNS